MKPTSEPTSNFGFYCVKEASVASGLSLAELYRLARLGEVAHFYEGKQLRFHPDELERFLQNQEKRISK